VACAPPAFDGPHCSSYRPDFYSVEAPLNSSATVSAKSRYCIDQKALEILALWDARHVHTQLTLRPCMDIIPRRSSRRNRPLLYILERRNQPDSTRRVTYEVISCTIHGFV
jgi:hypothetical protein